MAERPASASLRQFLSDLVAIREKGGYTHQDIFLVTKVTPYLIDQFEKGGLDDHPLFNELYLRAFVRSYATAVDIPDDVALDAYEQAMQGGYRRELAVRYLGMTRQELELEDPQPVRQFEYVPPAESEPEEAPPPAAPVEEATEEPEPPALMEAVSEKVQGAAGSLMERMKEGLMSLRAGRGENAAVQWSIIGGGLALVVLLVYVVFQVTRSGGPEEVAEASTLPPVVVDTLFSADTTSDPESQLVAVEQPIAPPPSQTMTLGDSLQIHIVAVKGSLSPFRARIDNDLRRPYWLEQGDTMRFNVANQIILEEQIDSMAVNIEGFDYPLTYIDTLGRVTITRDSARAFLSNHVRLLN